MTKARTMLGAATVVAMVISMLGLAALPSAAAGVDRSRSRIDPEGAVRAQTNRDRGSPSLSRAQKPYLWQVQEALPAPGFGR